MKISLTDAGKRFNRDWIFRHLNYNFETGDSYAIIGPNGSGKSTLLQVLGGSMHISQGSVDYSENGTQYPSQDIYRHISFCTPYMELIEEMTLKEFLHFHQGFKPFLAGMQEEQIVSVLGLEDAVNKQIRYYSSGMKQRVKLAQAILSDTAIVLLDEPCTNLDLPGIDLYNQLVDAYCKKRLVVVSSNDEVEYRFCNKRINIMDHK